MTDKKFDSQTELERDLRLQLAKKDSEIASLSHRNASLTEQLQNERQTHYNKENVLCHTIEQLRILSDTQNKLLERYQKHIDLSFTANSQRLLMLPSGEEK